MALISEEVPVSSEINSINNHKQIVSQSKNAFTSDILDNISNFDICQSINTEHKSPEDKADDNFLDLKEKKRVSNKIRQCNRERKLKCKSTIQDISSDLSHVIETVNDQDLKLLYNQNLKSFT
ncbi:16666_t:CDS:1, partial [Cetraspora pellucida]